MSKELHSDETHNDRGKRHDAANCAASASLEASVTPRRAETPATTKAAACSVESSGQTYAAESTSAIAENTPPDPMPDEEMLYDLADLFKTFGDTTRIKILYALMERELCVADLASIIGASQSAVSHQLRTLKQARLVKFQRDGKNVIYALSDDHVYTMLAQGMTHICE